MNRTDLQFDRPETLVATTPPECRGLNRDEVRLLVSRPEGHTHTRFANLVNFLEPGDILVVNESATIPASLPAEGKFGHFILNQSTNYGNNLWLIEPRWSPAQSGPLPISSGDIVQAAGIPVRMVVSYPGISRLWFAQIEGDLETAMYKHGQPITYGYIENPPGLDMYQTLFSTIPGSSEMPSAARPFTRRVLEGLQSKGIEILSIILHTGVSSLEVEFDNVEEQPLFPEPFCVTSVTAEGINKAKLIGSRVIAVGTTVVRALESAWNGEKVQARRGFSRYYIYPGREINVIDGLLTGMHDPVTSHLALLYAISGKEMIKEAYQEALNEGYLWHEFGDSHLIRMR